LNLEIAVRVTNYDAIAAGYDRRYALHEYAGVKQSLSNFLSGGSSVDAVLEVGCGTGHWLAARAARTTPSPAERTDRAAASAERLFGVEPSSGMIARARAAAPGARLVRARAEALPWRDATFDRVYCVNALHHFADRVAFFAEARRILKPGGGLLTIGKDPHADRDGWWVYDYFPETLAIDRQRFARVRTLRGELAVAGFAWTESFECDRIESLMPATDALTAGVVDRAYTSQLTVLSDDEFAAGVARIRAANAAAGGALQLTADFWLYATVGWV
jgi:ubiquinone/menaquinone biosynthesis C-methylase UbiE